MWLNWSVVASAPASGCAPEHDIVDLETCRGEARIEREQDVHSKREAEEMLRQESESLESPEDSVWD